MSYFLKLAGLSVAIILLVGCAATHKAEYGEFTGFLGPHYKLLKDDPTGGKFYVNKDVKPGTFTKVKLDPIAVFRGEKAQEEGIPREDMQRMADAFYTVMYETLKQDWEMVDKLGPKTVHFQMALTSAEDRWVGLDTVSTVVPQLKVVRAVKTAATGKPPFVGGAAMEAIARDSLTGKVVGLRVDKRVGGTSLSKGVDSYADALTVFEFWAKLLRYRMCKALVGTNCVEPQA